MHQRAADMACLEQSSCSIGQKWHMNNMTTVQDLHKYLSSYLLWIEKGPMGLLPLKFCLVLVKVLFRVSSNKSWRNLRTTFISSSTTNEVMLPYLDISKTEAFFFIFFCCWNRSHSTQKKANWLKSSPEYLLGESAIQPPLFFCDINKLRNKSGHSSSLLALQALLY